MGPPFSAPIEASTAITNGRTLLMIAQRLRANSMEELAVNATTKNRVGKNEDISNS